MGITYMRCKVILIVRIFYDDNNANNACSRNRPRCSHAHEALRSGLAANGRRADQSRGGPLQEGGAVTRGPSNESRPRMSEPRPRRRRNGGQIIAPRLLERFIGLRFPSGSLVLRQLERVVWFSDRISTLVWFSDRSLTLVWSHLAGVV